MRAFILLLALVATPFVAGVSQDQSKSGRPSDPKTVHCERRSDRATELRLGKDNCPRPAPAPTPVPAGAWIDGRVYHDFVLGKPGLANWVVDLSGVDTLGAPVSASKRTDASGRYKFDGLRPGTYTVCETVESGWRQTWPPQGSPCLTGVGYTFDLWTSEEGAGMIDFGNAMP
jgi:hypothetical protein